MLMVAKPSDDTLPRSLGVISLVLFVLFITGLASVLFPVRLLNIAWQLRLISALISAALAPLLGLVLLRLAIALDPRDPRLLRQWRLCSRLAVAASLGFLLLLPLHIQAEWRQNQTLRQAQLDRVQRAEAQLSRLRQAVSRADSQAALNQGLRQLSGPTLSSRDLTKPLPLLKAQVQEAFTQAELAIRREQQRLSARSTWKALPEMIRIGVASLALGIGFASLAQRRGARLTLLREWLQILEALQPKRLFQRQPRPHQFSDRDYILELSGEPTSQSTGWRQQLSLWIRSMRTRAHFRRLARLQRKHEAALQRLNRIPQGRSRSWRQAIPANLETLRRRFRPRRHPR